MQLKKLINDENTANILLVICRNKSGDKPNGQSNQVDPVVGEILNRAFEEIPTVSKVSSLPALILPRQGRKGKCSSSEVLEDERKKNSQNVKVTNDGIDYELLAKDRSLCSVAELDKIRRERNRMHAKRTRDRKRMFLDDMETTIKQLEAENDKLRNHVKLTHGSSNKFRCVSEDSSHLMNSSDSNTASSSISSICTSSNDKKRSIENKNPADSGKVNHSNQMNSLLVAVETLDNKFSHVSNSTVQSSVNGSDFNDDENELSPSKRRCFGIPKAITTTRVSTIVDAYR